MARTSSASGKLWILRPLLGLAAWGVLYAALSPASTWLAAHIPFVPDGHMQAAVAFFVYETPKVLLLLALVVFVIAVLRSWFPAERARAFLAGRNEAFGNVAAASLGVMTPFCSCSAVPLFLGFVSAGVPLGVTFSFLIASPMINEVALGLLLALAGWKIAAAYLIFGLVVAIVAGWLIGRLKLESWLEPWVRELRTPSASAAPHTPSPRARIDAGRTAVRDIVGKVWLWVVAGIAIGAGIHGYVPKDVLAVLMGKDAWWSVPAAVGIGIPMYANAAGIIPIVEALLGKGAALGTVLAFMMSVTALSLPEMILLRKILSLRLIAVFVGIVASGILTVGYLFNLLFV